MRRVRGRATIAAVVMAMGLAAVAGCGGDDPAERLSAAELTERVNDACAAASERIDAAAAPETEDELAAFAREAQAATVELMETLRSLEGEEPAQRGLDRLLTAYDRSAEIAREIAAAYRDDDTERAEELRAELQGIGAQAERDATAAGFDACADI
jgi:uncharacterized protein Yka (UPF0111/DUF47 family)